MTLSPIDPARVLGLDGEDRRTDVQTALSRRLTPPAWASFSRTTLEARAAWLEYAADVLRHRPASPPEGPAARLAALVLRLETGDAWSAFEAAGTLRSANDPRNDAYRSGPLGDDLAELIEHGCRSVALSLHRQRRFEAEDRLLTQGAALLGADPGDPRIEAIGRERLRLIPYRILDLLSREMPDREARDRGLGLLLQLLRRRARIDGVSGGDGTDLDEDSFALFLKQIRAFMTVQEWTECCEERHRLGDATAPAQLAEALVASGFQQRKPERIERALALLEQQEHPAERTLALVHLLLGDVSWALALAGAPGSEEEEVSLAGLCEECDRWLGRSVLRGCRDSDPTVDLEAWFADREVLEHLELRSPERAEPQAPRQETNVTMPVFSFGEATPARTAEAPARPAKSSARAPSPEPPVRAEPPAPAQRTGPPEKRATRRGDPAAGLRRAARRQGLAAGGPKRSVTTPASQERPRVRRNPSESRRRTSPHPAAGPLAYTVLGAGLSLGLQALVGSWRQATSGRVSEPAVPASKQSATPAAGAAGRQRALPLTAVSPDEGQLRGLLQDWLDLKGSFLAGNPPTTALQGFASPSIVGALREHRRGDQERGRTQRTLARVERVKVLERGDDVLSIEARIRYADEILARDGAVVNRTPLMRLRNSYRFRRENGTWRLEDWRQIDPGTPIASLAVEDSGTEP